MINSVVYRTRIAIFNIRWKQCIEYRERNDPSNSINGLYGWMMTLLVCLGLMCITLSQNTCNITSPSGMDMDWYFKVGSVGIVRN